MHQLKDSDNEEGLLSDEQGTSTASAPQTPPKRGICELCAAQTGTIVSTHADEEPHEDEVVQLAYEVTETYEEEYKAEPLEGDSLEVYNARRVYQAEKSLNQRNVLEATR